MKIIDAQVHLWSQTVIPPGGGHRQVKASGRGAAGGDGRSGCRRWIESSAGELGSDVERFSDRVAKKYPDCFAIMGQFPPDDRDNERLIAGWRNTPA